MIKKQLIIIPGLGNRVWLYDFIKPIWALLGFDVYIFNSHWGDSRLVFKDVFNRLLRFINDLNSKEVYIIGVSAGGTMAVNALVDCPNSIIKIVTVCTPYKLLSNQKNKLLVNSIKKLVNNLQRISNDQRSRILSVYGFCDHAVPFIESRPKNIKVKRILSIGHVFSIIIALTLYSVMIKRFLLSMR